jgi:hypothetical protein
VYVTPEGKIDYLALVEKGQNTFEVSPENRRRSQSNGRVNSRSPTKNVSSISRVETHNPMTQARIFENTSYDRQ